MESHLVFDAVHYERLNAARTAVVTELLNEIKNSIELRSAVDIGCGVGYFSRLLDSCGLQVIAVDGRLQNVEEARRRSPAIDFRQFNIEDPTILGLGRFDLGFCFGLLYHLENPMLAIRHASALTRGLLLIEAVIFPGNDPIMALIDEGPGEDQGMNHFAFYPTEACLIKMLYLAGFPFVCRFKKLPDHVDYRAALGWRRARTMLVASHEHLRSTLLTPAPEPKMAIHPWDGASGVGGADSVNRLLRFATKPLPQKVETIKRLLRR